MLALLSEHMGTILSLILGGGLATGLSQLVKAMADSRKTRTEADKMEMSLATETETITVATMKEAIATMRDLAADANLSRERAERNEVALRARLDALEAHNRELAEKVAALELDDRVKDKRISRLEENLGTAKHTAARLAAALREAGIDPDPPIDYSIFDV